jgi:hypothetical protein
MNCFTTSNPITASAVAFAFGHPTAGVGAAIALIKAAWGNGKENVSIELQMRSLCLF